MEQKNVLVIGCARSGLGAAKLALKVGHNVTLYDGKTMEKFDEKVRQELKKLQEAGVALWLGEQGYKTGIQLVIVLLKCP